MQMNSLILRYRNLYEHEKDSNARLLAMLNSVPKQARSDARFSQAVNLAAHLVACRENWLDRILTKGERQAPWFEDAADLAALPARFEATEAAWTAYLAARDDSELAAEFTFPLRGGQEFRFYVEGQLLQLVGHGNYHRGQIALLVDQLGGQSVDTDYLFWTCSPDGTFRRVEGE